MFSQLPSQHRTSRAVTSAAQWTNCSWVCVTLRYSAWWWFKCIYSAITICICNRNPGNCRIDAREPSPWRFLLQKKDTFQCMNNAFFQYIYIMYMMEVGLVLGLRMHLYFKKPDQNNVINWSDIGSPMLLGSLLWSSVFITFHVSKRYCFRSSSVSICPLSFCSLQDELFDLWVSNMTHTLSTIIHWFWSGS